MSANNPQLLHFDAVVDEHKGWQRSDLKEGRALGVVVNVVDDELYPLFITYLLGKGGNGGARTTPWGHELYDTVVRQLHRQGLFYGV